MTSLALFVAFLSKNIFIAPCAMLDGSPQGNAVICIGFKISWVDVELLQGFLQTIFASFLWPPDRAGALCHLGIDYCLWKSLIWVSLHVPSPPQHPLSYKAVERVTVAQ